ncbi:fam53b [Pungitius sinensis]
MVIIFLKTLEKKKGVDDVRSNNTERRPPKFHSMSKGTTLLSRGTVEADRWLDLGQSCAIQQRAPCQSGASPESLWGAMPEPGGWHWAKEPGSATAITSLIRDLSLGNGRMTTPDCPATSTTAERTTPATCQAPAAPPSKRQCRSLSFSDELAGFRSPWRPQGSRVWTTVEKRRCHSGGSVRGAAGFSSGHLPAVQRSSSFSLPSRSSLPSDGAVELPFFHRRLPLRPQFTASPVSPTSPSSHHHHHHHPPRHPHFLRPLSLSHEQISLPELQREEKEEEEEGEEASEASSPDSTPELGRRAGPRARAMGRLSRSKSQPCVLNDKKMAMKRRRPEDAQEPRPSLDLAKMNQKRQTFQSLSCPGFSDGVGGGGGWPGPPPPSSHQPDSDFSAATSEAGSRRGAAGDGGEEDSSFEELDSDSACSVDSRPCTPEGTAGGKGALWKGGTRRDIFQLGGELDLDQIERN